MYIPIPKVDPIDGNIKSFKNKDNNYVDSSPKLLATSSTTHRKMRLNKESAFSSSVNSEINILHAVKCNEYEI
jgi:hypothetical protein